LKEGQKYIINIQSRLIHPLFYLQLRARILKYWR